MHCAGTSQTVAQKATCTAFWWGVKTCLTVSNPPILKQECSGRRFLSKQRAAGDHLMGRSLQQTASYSDKGNPELWAAKVADLDRYLLLSCTVLNSTHAGEFRPPLLITHPGAADSLPSNLSLQAS